MGFSLRGALSGAIAGGSVGGMPGAIAGGVLGGVASGGEEKRLNESNKISEQAYQNLDPYRQAGNVALNRYMELLGLDPISAQQPAAPGVPTMGAPGSGQPAQSRSIEDLLRATPGYAFQTAEEERAIERAAAGRGQRISGNVLEELATRAGQRAIGTAYGTQLDRLAQLSAAGQNAAAGQGGIAGGISSRRYDAAAAGNESRDTLLASGIQAAGSYFGRKPA